MDKINSVVQKRPRDELEGEVDFEECSNTKRNKPYNHILTILESEEEESTQDLSPLMTTLQQEITCTPSNNNSHQSQLNDQNTLHTTNPNDQNTLTSIHQEEEENDKERVMRHLLQASDDELGIPSSGDEYGSTLDFGEFGFRTNNNGEYGEGENNNGFSSLCDNLWELEDEAANYYTLLQSELFLWEQ
ncbi:hypothetical protein HN51_007844 [Arachis hypogaea]|uniref:Uncharacterized protein n=2 Tax=Arachis TaxID=3817 RepID=A0A445D6A5_ARAHY|nr:uncharacterized protein LOC107489237 [Arachis duranensis]XP_025700106.1 uncharacterized protein LOC112801532 [Arachis hypogaea]QHO42072.1 uncharacterized protein DS421_5g151100 [Arachis hypogaea]RYR58651.1 hypothetical protein Ahy_A05g024524 isoform B [Arachis hypogaea]